MTKIQITTLVTDGIYSISRNPAFLGFDLMYLGILLAFPNACNAVATAITILLFYHITKGKGMTWARNAVWTDYAIFFQNMLLQCHEPLFAMR